MSMDFKGEVRGTVYGVPRARPTPKFGPSRTKQEFKDRTDVNKIIARYKKSGMVEHLTGKLGFYGDVSELVSYQDALHVVMKAERLFSAMSAEIRSRFGNDPMRMIDFLNDPKNVDEAKRLGMIVERPGDPVAKVQVVDGSGKPVEPPKGGEGAGGAPK